MAHNATHTEMTGTGGGRWDARETAKHESNRARRRNDSSAVEAGLTEYYDDNDD